MKRHLTMFAAAIGLVAGCSEPPQPRSVQMFLDNPLVLEAALVRCSRNRAETRYDAECINAREANKIVSAREEATRRAEFEAQSERKRQALRRAQQAAAEARRRAAEAERRREEAAYLAQFGQLPTDGEQASSAEGSGNVPIAVLPEPVEATTDTTEQVYREPLSAEPSGASNAPTVAVEPEQEAPRNLDEIREELKRRNED